MTRNFTGPSAILLGTPSSGCMRAEPPEAPEPPGVLAARDLPHVLVLITWNGPYDGEDSDIWDYADLECPHQPSETMPCAVWVDCGCPIKASEITDPEAGTGQGPCPRSATGQHRYVEGEPQRPGAECWALQWTGAELCDAAFDLSLPPGRYEVRPWRDGNTFRLELVGAQAVTR